MYFLIYNNEINFSLNPNFFFFVIYIKTHTRAKTFAFFGSDFDKIIIIIGNEISVDLRCCTLI